MQVIEYFDTLEAAASSDPGYVFANDDAGGPMLGFKPDTDALRLAALLKSIKRTVADLKRREGIKSKTKLSKIIVCCGDEPLRHKLDSCGERIAVNVRAAGIEFADRPDLVDCGSAGVRVGIEP